MQAHKSNPFRAEPPRIAYTIGSTPTIESTPGYVTSLSGIIVKSSWPRQSLNLRNNWNNLQVGLTLFETVEQPAWRTEYNLVLNCHGAKISATFVSIARRCNVAGGTCSRDIGFLEAFLEIWLESWSSRKYSLIMRICVTLLFVTDREQNSFISTLRLIDKLTLQQELF